MSTRPNSRNFQLRRAAEREANRRWLLPTYRLNKADANFRVRSAFEAGADWERKRWIKQQKARDLAYLQPQHRSVYA